MNTIDTFAARARDFVSWAERKSPSAPAADAYEVLGLLVQLYDAALKLPEGEAADDERPATSEEEWRQVYSRCANLSFDLYWEMFNPHEQPPEEPVCASLGDDLADVHRDLMRGFSYYDNGEPAAAAWEWQFHFRVHWGHHASAAIYALHAWYASVDDGEPRKQVPEE